MVIGIDASRAYISDKTGTENYSFHLISAMLRLPESKKHVFVLFTRPNAILPTELGGYSNVTVKEIRMKYLWTQLGLAWETWGKRRLDVLWVPAHTLPILRNPKVKTVVTIHGLEYQWLPEYKNWLQRWYLPLSTFYAAKSADKLIAVSKFTANQLVKELHTSPKKIKVIYEGVDFRQSEYSENQKTRKPENQIYQKFGIIKKQYILFVGSIQPRKNLVALIEAFSQFNQANPRYKLVLAGGIGWLSEEIFLAPQRFGVQESVIFAGRVSDLELRALYLGATIYVQPSITEGFGLPVLEAMSAHVPVISSDGGALREVVGGGGIIVSLKSDFVKELAVAMKRVLSSINLRNDLISMGLKRVKMFSWDKAAKASLQVIVE